MAEIRKIRVDGTDYDVRDTSKIPVDQGTANAGKVLAVGSDGKAAPSGILGDKVDKTQTINGKALNANITLDANDIPYDDDPEAEIVVGSVGSALFQRPQYNQVVRVDGEQSLTDAQKATGRGNIGAADVGSVEELNSAVSNTNNYLGAKNLACIPNKTNTINGITIAWNNGIAVINGTSTAVVYYNFASLELKTGRNYQLNGCCDNASLYVLDSSNNVIAQANYGQDIAFSVLTDGEYNLRLRIPTGKTFENAEFTPMVRYTGTSSTFVPYVPTNEELAADISAVKTEFQNADTILSGRIDAVDVKSEAATTAVDGIESSFPRNLFSPSIGTASSSGITITNANGIITLDGTATATVRAGIGSIYLEAGNYILSGMNNQYIALQLLNSDNSQVIAAQQSGVEMAVSIEETDWYNLRVYISNGRSLENEKVYPMIRSAYMINSEFEPLGAGNIALWIGDSYVQANSLSAAGLNQRKRFSTQVCEHFGWFEVNYAVGGMGFIEGNTPYLAQLQNAISDTSYNHYNVKRLFICGGRNDMNNATLTSNLYSAVIAVLTLAASAFPNAEIIMVPMTYDSGTISQEGFYTYKTIIRAAASFKATIIKNAYMWLTGMKGYILADNVHPNVDGHTLIASHICDALSGGDSFPYPASLALSVASDKIDTSKNNYCCLLQTHGEISVNAIFTLTSAAAKYDTLYSATVNSLNCPTFIGKYGKHIPIFNMDTGDTGVILVIDTQDTAATTTAFQAMTTLEAGTWKVMSAQLQFGVQEYSGNMT